MCNSHDEPDLNKVLVSARAHMAARMAARMQRFDKMQAWLTQFLPLVKRQPSDIYTHYNDCERDEKYTLVSLRWGDDENCISLEIDEYLCVEVTIRGRCIPDFTATPDAVAKSMNRHVL